MNTHIAERKNAECKNNAKIEKGAPCMQTETINRAPRVPKPPNAAHVRIIVIMQAAWAN